MRSLLLLVSDSRFPAGGHAHSGGVEQACEDGVIDDLPQLEGFLRGRLATAGLIGACIAARICAGVQDGADLDRLWRVADMESDARMPSPAARYASRKQGGQLLRTADRVFEADPLASLAAAAALTGSDPHQAVVMGVVAAVAGLSPGEAAMSAAYASVAGPASAALRLLGLDPAGTGKVLAGIAEDVDAVAAVAARDARRPLRKIPSPSSPILDLLAEEHFGRKERLFAS
ncbi:MAG TPA: urease accessory UreF family protein [Acidimicrobiales bacterium]